MCFQILYLALFGCQLVKELYIDIPCSSPMPFQTYIHSFIHLSIHPFISQAIQKSVYFCTKRTQLLLLLLLLVLQLLLLHLRGVIWVLQMLAAMLTVCLCCPMTHFGFRFHYFLIFLKLYKRFFFSYFNVFLWFEEIFSFFLQRYFASQHFSP